jgi:hypothetical protein
MSEDELEEAGPLVSIDPEIREVMSLFDLPAFARRGQDVEFSVSSIHARCRQRREEMLEMVRLRLRQWSRVATGPDDWAASFTGPIEDLWMLSGSPSPCWSPVAASPRRQQALARELVSSLERFNHRWQRFLESINLEPANLVIDQYNKYYILEKECVMGSARLAARHFSPISRFTPVSLLNDYPLLPVPALT